DEILTSTRRRCCASEGRIAGDNSRPVAQWHCQRVSDTDGWRLIEWSAGVQQKIHGSESAHSFIEIDTEYRITCQADGASGHGPIRGHQKRPRTARGVHDFVRWSRSKAIDHSGHER